MERRSSSLRVERKAPQGSVLSSLALVIVSLAAVAGAAQLYADGQDLQASEKARAALEANIKGAGERVSEAESARAEVEAALAEEKSARVDAEGSLAKARRGKEAARLSLKQARVRLAAAEAARTRAENGLQAVTAELARLQSAKKALEAAAANTEKDLEQERAAAQAAKEAAVAAAIAHEVTVSPETTASTREALPTKLDRVFLPTSSRSNVPPATQTKDKGTRMEECMAAWDKATHMSKAVWRRTCRDTLSVDF